MPIEITCSSCQRKLRLPDRVAGKKVKCPKCQGVLQVPAGSEPEAPAADAGDGTWTLKTEGGDEYGPVPKSEMDEWLAEGRLTAASQLLRTGADQWQWASEIYPQLEGDDDAPHEEPAAAESESGGESENPFSFAGADEPSASPAGAPSFDVGADASPTARATGRSKGRGGRSRRVTKTASPPAEGESDRSRLVAGLLAIFLGSVGAHRFYLGHVLLGVLLFATLGGCGLWSLIDAILIFVGKTTDAQGRPLRD